MTREWKPGDRFTLELEVTGWSGEWLECKTMISARRAFPSSDMQHAKLIAPAAPETQKLDVTKPMRFRGGGTQVAYIDRTESGLLAVRDDHRCILLLAPSELENIPGPKRTYEQIVELVPFSDGLRIVSPGNPLSYVNVASRAKVSYTDGEGWSVEEVL